MTHIMVWRGELPEDSIAGFWHHGIRLGDGTVVHYSGMDGMKTLHNAQIMHTPPTTFCSDPTRIIHQVDYPPSRHRFDARDVERRALSRVGLRQYHLFSHNCETFARWCVTGRSASFQSQAAVLGAGCAALSLLVGGGLAGAALTGFVVTRVWESRRNPSSTRHAFARHRDDDSDDGRLPTTSIIP